MLITSDEKYTVKLAPIAIFAYNRPQHIQTLIESLLKNDESHDSSITVYCDGARAASEQKMVLLTRELVKDLLPNAHIVEREQNIGLANSIISGVSEQCDKYGRVIVFEDDLELAKDALKYFHNALEKYKDECRVMHVSGYTLPVKKKLNSGFFFREASSWGWATWQRAWQYFQHDSWLLAQHIYCNKLIKKFNTEHSYHYWEMLNAMCEKKIDSWAILWYASIFIRDGLALYPGNSKIRNTGLDGSGIHCGETTEYDVIVKEGNVVLPKRIEEEIVFLKEIIKYRYKGRLAQVDFLLRNYISLLRYLRHKNKLN